MVDSESVRAVAKQALQLSAEGAAPADSARVLAELGGSREILQGAREIYVGRLQTRSDDFEASQALRMLNAALAQLGFVTTRFGAGPTGDGLTLGGRSKAAKIKSNSKAASPKKAKLKMAQSKRIKS